MGQHLDAFGRGVAVEHLARAGKAFDVRFVVDACDVEQPAGKGFGGPAVHRQTTTVGTRGFLIRVVARH